MDRGNSIHCCGLSSVRSRAAVERTSNVALTRRAGRDVPPSRQLVAPRAPARHVHKASSVTAVT